MKDDKPSDFYRIAFYCGLMVVGWAFQVSSIRQFAWMRHQTKPPQFHVVDFNQERLFPEEPPDKPVAQILAEKGMKAEMHFVSKEEGARLQREYQIKKWGPLAVAIVGALVAAWLAWLLSGSGWITMLAIIFAPLVLHFMRERDWHRGP
jgi:hypothetical protein